MARRRGTDDPSDEALVAAAQAGDDAAFLQLTARFRPVDVRFLAGQVSDPSRVDELAQQTFDAAYDDLQRLRDPTLFGAWLLAIARHRLLDNLRRRQHVVSLEQVHLPPPTPTPVLTGVLIEEALGALSDELRQIVRLRSEGYSVPEIAARLGRTRSAVQRGLSRARKALRVLDEYKGY